MPGEEIYQPQMAPRAAAAMPLVSADAYGAGLGRQVAAFGEQLHQDQLQHYQIERQRTADAELTRFGHDFAVARESMDGIAREARKDGSTGHAARMGHAWDAQREHLLDGITEGSVRRRAEAQLDDWGGKFRGAEADFEEIKRTDQVLTDYAATQDIAANRIRRLDKPDDYLTEIDLGHSGIDGLSIGAYVKAKLHREWDQQGAVAFLRGRIDADPQVAKAMIAGGLFDHALSPDQTEGLLNGADVEIRRQDAQREHVQALAKQSFEQQVRTVDARASQGMDVTADVPSLIDQAKKLGLPDVQVKLEGLAADGKFARTYEPQTPIQREAKQRGLEAILPEKRTADQARELKWLKDHQSGLDGDFNRNPVDFFLRNGGPGAPPPLDWNNPASVQARAQWATATAAAVHRPVAPLSSNEAADLAASWSTGQSAAQRDVLDKLAQFGGNAGGAAAQVVPGDPGLAVLAVLPKSYRDMALTGRDVLKANPKRIDPVLAGSTEKDTELESAMRKFDTGLDEALSVFPPTQRAAIKQTAQRILAADLDQDGTPVTAGRYFKALSMATGATWGAGPFSERRGGIATWGEHWFKVPDGMAREQFAPAIGRAVARMAVKPVNSDGSPAVLSQAFPVAVGGGLYEFHTPSGAVVRGSDNKPWRAKP